MQIVKENVFLEKTIKHFNLELPFLLFFFFICICLNVSEVLLESADRNYGCFKEKKIKHLNLELPSFIKFFLHISERF